MNAVVEIKARLPQPAGMEMTPGTWRVLCESIFPTARSPEAIVLAFDYCMARKLDIMKKPVHIVPMWSASLNREVETVWPSITEVQTTAARTGKYAGMDEPKFGQRVKQTFKGKKGNNVGDTEVEVEFPEWCSVTVYRMVDGQRCAFTEPVYWMESYARSGKTELPNAQWTKRPIGMIIKVAKAFSLRAAFPEEGSYTSEEMEGRVIEETDGVGNMVDVTEPLKKAPAFKNASARNTFHKNTLDSFAACETIQQLNTIITEHKGIFDSMRSSGNEHDMLSAEDLNTRYKLRLEQLKENAKVDTNTVNKELDERITANADDPPAFLHRSNRESNGEVK